MRVMLMSLLLVTGCSGSTGTEGERVTPVPESPTVSESAPTATPESTQPTGTFTWRSERVRVVPEDTSSKLGKGTQRGSWRFETDRCGETDCSGTMTSSGGAEYDWTWDGATLVLEFSPEPEEFDCGGGTSVRYQRLYNLGDVTVTRSADGGRPTGFTLESRQRIKILKNRNCDLDPKSLRLEVLSFTATQEGSR